MKSRKTIFIIAGAAVAVIALAVIGVNVANAAGPRLQYVSTSPLERMDLTNTVSVTGTVKSEDAVNVYSTLTYQIKTVNVEVGDVVREGDVLCEIDTDDIISKINQQTATITNSQAKAQYNLEVAQNNLETEKFNQEKNYDSALQQAEKGVTSAKSALVSAQNNLRSAQISWDAARKDLREFRDENGIGSDTSDLEYEMKVLYETKFQTVRKSEIAYDEAEKGVEDAKKAVEDAEQALKTTQIQKEEALVTGETQVTAAQLNANFSDQWLAVEEMKKDLDKALIKAPVSGTVTAVFATEGASGQGLLFVIEDTSRLKVTTKIKEYDIVSVVPGLLTKIKSDGVGDDEYEGKVSKIAPTAVKSAAGQTQETTDVQFDAEIGVTSQGTRLRIGMNARMEIITEEKKDVFAVAFDTLATNEDGVEVVYIARKKDDGSFAAEAAPVEIGMETDFYVEISSNAIQEGDLIISNPTGITDGMAVAPSGDLATGGAAAEGGGPRGGPRAAVRMGG